MQVAYIGISIDILLLMTTSVCTSRACSIILIQIQALQRWTQAKSILIQHPNQNESRTGSYEQHMTNTPTPSISEHQKLKTILQTIENKQLSYRLEYMASEFAFLCATFDLFRKSI